MKAKAVVVTLAVLLLAGTLGFALAPRAASADLSGAFGGDLGVALQDFGGLDPRTASPADRKVLELVYDSLGRIDPVTLQIEPLAATGWAWDGDKNISVTLRDDLAFSDGAAYDADDVAYSLSQYQKGGVSRWQVSAVDDTTLWFDFTAIPSWWNYDNSSGNQAGPGLFYTEGLTAFIAWDANGVQKYSGPFAVSSFSTVDKKLALVASEHYFLGRPKLDSVTYRWGYTLELNADGSSKANDAGCALMFQQVHLIGLPLLTNDASNLRDCIEGFGGFRDPQGTFTRTNVAGNATDTWGPGKGTYDEWLCNQTDANSVAVTVVVNAVELNATITSVSPGDNHDLGLWQDVDGNNRCDFGIDRQIAVSNGTAAGQTILVSRPAVGTYLAQIGLFSGSSGVFNVESTVMRAESLLSTDSNRVVRHVLTGKNQGTDFLYFGFSFNAGSAFTGAVGTTAQKLRSAVYLFVNKGLYRDIEPNTAVTHGTINRFNVPWSPTSCPPFTPCDLIVDASAVIRPPVARQTDTDPAVAALDLAGIIDRNGDGWREDAAGNLVSLTVISPSFVLDARKTTIAGDMAFLMNGIGLQTTVAAYDTWAAVDAAIASCAGNCFYIKRFSAATILPDWWYTMPEVLAANDPNVDLHLNLGGRSYTLALRTLHVGHVGHYISSGGNVLPVLHYDALEAFDFQTFTGWVDMLGGINNFWSFWNLRLPLLGSLSARVSVFPDVSLAPGATTTVQVEVRDAVGQAVGGADVAFSASAGSLSPATGVTTANGVFAATFTAPSVTSGVADVTVSAVATKTQYTGTSASGTLSVHAPGTAELTVAVSRGTATEIPSGGTAPITVEVRDAATDTPVQGATVVLRADLPGAEFAAASGTTGANGQFQTTFTATVKQGMTYRIAAEVTAAGYGEATGSASLAVSSNLGEPPVLDVTRNVPGFEATAAIGAIAVVFVVLTLLRRRRED